MIYDDDKDLLGPQGYNLWISERNNINISFSYYTIALKK